MGYKTNSFLMVSFLILFVVTGCANKEYSQFMTEFESKYFETIESIDITDTLLSLKNMNTKENKKNIEELRILLSNIENEIPDNRKEKYESYKKWYEGLVLLRDSYAKWNELTIDIQDDVWLEIRAINRRKENGEAK
jgi:predicted RND superfamily exporter protein